MQSRLQRKREKDSLKQAAKYLVFTFIGLFLLIRFGLPGLIRLASFVSELTASNQPIERRAGPAPAAPTLLALPEATNSAKISVTGFSEPGLTVKLSRGGIKIEDTLAGNDGRFEFKDIVLREGENEFYAEAVDDQDSSSEPSKSYTVIYDSEAPGLTVDQPQPSQRFFDKDSPITVKGKTEAQARLTLNGKFIFVDGEGSFETKWPLSEGDNQLDFISRDPAGNQTQKILTVNYTP